MNIVLKNAVLFTPEDPALRADLRITGDRIGAIAPDIPPEAGDTVLDLSGYTVFPGFINSHVHLVHTDGTPFTEETFRKFVRGGVTTVRDMGIMTPEPLEKPLSVMQTRTAPEFPRVVVCGKFITTDTSYGSHAMTGELIGEVVHSPEEVTAVVDRYADMGFTGVKTGMDTGVLIGLTCDFMPDEYYEALFAAAQRRGMWVSAHISLSKDQDRFLDFGKSEIAHLPCDEIPDALVARMKEEDICVCTTLTLWQMASQFSGMPLLQTAMANAKRLYDAGVRMAVGTDMTDEGDGVEIGIPFTELRLLREAGIPVEQIIHYATDQAAQTCRIQDETGSVVPGLSADLIAVKGPVDPDFNCFRELPLVINRGAVIVNRL